MGTGLFSAVSFHVASFLAMVLNCLEPDVLQSSFLLTPCKVGGITFSEMTFLIFKALAPSLAVRPVLDPDYGPDWSPDSR